MHSPSSVKFPPPFCSPCVEARGAGHGEWHGLCGSSPLRICLTERTDRSSSKVASGTPVAVAPCLQRYGTDLYFLLPIKSIFQDMICNPPCRLRQLSFALLRQTNCHTGLYVAETETTSPNTPPPRKIRLRLRRTEVMCQGDQDTTAKPLT